MLPGLSCCMVLDPVLPVRCTACPCNLPHPSNLPHPDLQGFAPLMPGAFIAPYPYCLHCKVCSAVFVMDASSLCTCLCCVHAHQAAVSVIIVNTILHLACEWAALPKPLMTIHFADLRVFLPSNWSDYPSLMQTLEGVVLPSHISSDLWSHGHKPNSLAHIHSAPQVKASSRCVRRSRPNLTCQV